MEETFTQIGQNMSGLSMPYGGGGTSITSQPLKRTRVHDKRGSGQLSYTF